MTEYWKDETPQIVDTGKNVLKLFPKAERLQVSMPSWTNAEGQQKPGKTITLNLAAIKESPEAVGLLRQIIT